MYKVSKPRRYTRKQSRKCVKGTQSAGVIGDGLEVKQSTIPGAGLGLFATRTFRKNHAITQYIGVIISAQEARRIRVQNSLSTSHMASLTSTEIIDASNEIPRKGKPGGVFANHQKSPNAYLCVETKTNVSGRILRYKNDPRLIASCTLWLVANDNIECGEIFLNYGKQFWR